jgi:S-adenosylmethionine decarboxylase
MTETQNQNFAPGVHLIIDFWDTTFEQNEKAIAKILAEAASTCGATILDIRLHSFGENSGITGVALLAESHISIHTWPEINFVALDVFMCGNCDPHKAVPILRSFFMPQRERIEIYRRGASLI